MKNNQVLRFMATNALLIAIVYSGLVSAETRVKTKWSALGSTAESLKLGGIIHYDYIDNETPDGGENDQFKLRRGWLSVSGAVSKSWYFKSQFNADGGGTLDQFIRYKGWGKIAQITLGKHKVPFAMDFLTGSNDLTVLEHSAITKRNRVGRQEGISILSQPSDTITLSAGVFNDGRDSSLRGLAARGTWTPIKSKASTLHVGTAYKDFNNEKMTSLELALSYRQLHFQAESFSGKKQGNNIQGGYFQAGYFFTGESRPYKSGVFKRAKPLNKHGALEAVLRFETGDGKFNDTGLGLNDADSTTYGLNWYATKQARFGINFSEAKDSSKNQSGSQLRIRAQLTF